MRLPALIVAAVLAVSTASASAAPLSVELTPDAGNPASPQMGDRLRFRTLIRNDGPAPIDGVIAWISLVQIDRGQEQPVDLEDWSAQKAVTAASLQPGQALQTDWPLRLIQAGTYRVVVSVVSREGTGLVASPFADFTVRQKPVVESARILPVAFGAPLLLIGMMVWRRRSG
jgi:hypothetical protein